MTSEYLDFIAGKRLRAEPSGFECGPMQAPLFPWQARNVRWACSMGRSALFLDTGLGKTAQQLEWAHQVSAHTGHPVLVLAPLAVAQQTVREAAKFGIPGVAYAREQAEAHSAITVTNYERLAAFEPKRFGGVVLDEASILKSYVGATKRALVTAFERTPYRLACSATPAPNDHVELGNHSEFLGILPAGDMLTRWFLSDTTSANKLRLKRHAVDDFWDWVASWAVVASLPSDLGDYSDAGYVLPKLEVHEHLIDAGMSSPDLARGLLFKTAELNATAVHGERRRTAEARAAAVAEVVRAEPNEQWLIWCETDYEADALMAVLPEGAAEVRGSQPLAIKEDRLVAFVTGNLRILVTKPKIAGLGLNLQHVARVAFVGATFSFESYYQAIRRCWRFGQTRQVHVHVFMATTERPVWQILVKKMAKFDDLKRGMNAATRRGKGHGGILRDHTADHDLKLPLYLRRNP